MVIEGLEIAPFFPSTPHPHNHLKFIEKCQTITDSFIVRHFQQKAAAAGNLDDWSTFCVAYRRLKRQIININVRHFLQKEQKIFGALLSEGLNEFVNPDS